MNGESNAGARQALLGHAAIITTTLLWGSLVPLMSILLESIDAYAISAIRYGIAILILGPLTLRQKALLRRLPLGKILRLGTFGIAGFTTLYTLGIGLSDPGSAIVVNSATPIISAIFATLVYRIPPAPGVGVSLGLAALGGLVASIGSATAAGGLGFRGGEALIVLAGLCWSWYSIVAQRWLGHLQQTQLTAVTMLGAMLPLLGAWLAASALGAARFPAEPSLGTIALLVFVGIGSTLTGVSFWNYAVARLGVVVCSLYLSLLPVIGMITTAALGKIPTSAQLAGAAIVMIGIAQIHLRRLLRPAV